MSSCVTLREAMKLLTTAAYELAPIIKQLLEVWLQTSDELPKHLQLPSTAAATELVQAALQQAPWPMQQHEPRQLAWLQKHLPQIKKAMRESVIRQLSVTATRVSILQSLSRTHDGAQMSATTHAERTAQLPFSIMTWVLYQISPATVLCTELSLASQVRTQGARMQHDPDQQHRLQQGNNLISRVAAGLKDAKDMLEQVASQYHDPWKDLGGPEDELFNDPAHQYSMLACKQCQRHAGVIWLELLAQLPSKHESTAQFYGFISGHTLHKECLGKQMLIRAQQAFCQVLAQPALLWNLLTKIPRLKLQGEFHQLLCSLQVSADQLHAAGMNKAQAVQLLLDAAADIKPDARSGSSPSANSSSGNVLCNGSAAQTGAPAGDSGATNGDDSEFDMPALLQLMYGCTLQPNR